MAILLVLRGFKKGYKKSYKGYKGYKGYKNGYNDILNNYGSLIE